MSQSPPKTGIRVLVVGAGFAGLTAAIECHRKGHSVTLLEKFPELKLLGDIISFGPNSSRIFQRWPGVAEKMDALSQRSDGLEIKNWLGETLLKQVWSKEQEEFGIRFDGHRGEFHEIVYKHALEIGVDIRLGARVEDYFESDDEAGVVLEGGERITANIVLAAEGVRSPGRKIVLGYEDKPKASGYAVYRVWFDADEIAKDPDLRFFTDNGDKHVAWLGPDVHFIAASVKNGKDFSWVCTHKDEADIEESWSLEAPLSDARKVLEGWDPVVQKILDYTPSPLIDWKLVYRDPLPTWISSRRRIALIGDSAHPFLPTSIQGASQAMEDGATIAVCLSRAQQYQKTYGNAKNSDGVQEAIATFEAIRYERVRSAQKTGEQTRDIWHKADFAAAKKDPQSLRLRREAWLLDFDAEMYAEMHYEETAAMLRANPNGGVLGDTLEARKLHIPEGKEGYLEYNEEPADVAAQTSVEAVMA
ncbi:putative monooxygenase [Xylaria bambusicola]|uniref:putative monooxygenase n=1 Tax=Xylaria bambusicola TaxID=326684 RepID=UPI0020086ED6|nr:putative monooxygenase [Xylaria bambusicola]KAI0521877.1 putative monooxygenase [Xylaria bambusicola]